MKQLELFQNFKKSKVLGKMKPLWISYFNGEICKIEILKQRILIVGVKI